MHKISLMVMRGKDDVLTSGYHFCISLGTKSPSIVRRTWCRVCSQRRSVHVRHMWIVEVFPIGEGIAHIGGIRRGSGGILDVSLNWGKCESPSAGGSSDRRRVVRGIVRSSHARRMRRAGCESEETEVFEGALVQ